MSSAFSFRSGLPSAGWSEISVRGSWAEAIAKILAGRNRKRCTGNRLFIRRVLSNGNLRVEASSLLVRDGPNPPSRMVWAGQNGRRVRAQAGHLQSPAETSGFWRCPIRMKSARSCAPITARGSRARSAGDLALDVRRCLGRGALRGDVLGPEAAAPRGRRCPGEQLLEEAEIPAPAGMSAGRNATARARGPPPAGELGRRLENRDKAVVTRGQ